MKQFFSLLLTAVLSAALLAGCGPTVNPDHSDAPSDDFPDSVPSMAATLYLPNEQADGFWTEDVIIEAPAAEAPAAILAELADRGILPGDTVLQAFTISQDEEGRTCILADLNQAFLEDLMASGTTGESMMLGALVNTFLDSYGAGSMVLTCDGETMETGHNIYDWPLTFADFPGVG